MGSLLQSTWFQTRDNHHPDMPPEFPVGPYIAEPNPTAVRRGEWIAEIKALPATVARLVTGLSEERLETKYRNWSVRQIVHHLADSHMNASVRFRLALTEDLPTIKPYDETRWAQLADSRTAEVKTSLRL